ncbi:hypothetical protein J4711_14495 [Staphylococcus epidermidis]|nr:hypothetical protein [Staphylococcus epidermidis]
MLPGPAGGVFGYMMGFNALKWLALQARGLIGICLFLLGEWCLAFPGEWPKAGRLDGMIQFGRERRKLPRMSAGKRRRVSVSEVVPRPQQ